MQEGKTEEKEVDLDELLDMEGDSARKKFLLKHLSDCKQTPDKIEVRFEQNSFRRINLVLQVFF